MHFQDEKISPELGVAEQGSIQNIFEGFLVRVEYPVFCESRSDLDHDLCNRNNYLICQFQYIESYGVRNKCYK